MRSVGDKDMSLAQRLIERMAGAPYNNGSRIRPFSCANGVPEDCNIFLVGTNPATILSNLRTQLLPNGFKDLYSVETETFDYARFNAAYPEPDSLNHTRGRIKLVRETAGTPIPDKNPDGLPKEYRVVDLLNILMEEIKPTLILLHGSAARKISGKPQLSNLLMIIRESFPQGRRLMRLIDLESIDLLRKGRLSFEAYITYATSTIGSVCAVWVTG